MTLESFEHSARCKWCRRAIKAFSGEPMLVEVTHKPDYVRQRHIDRICLDCYGELIKLMSRREQESRL